MIRHTMKNDRGVQRMFTGTLTICALLALFGAIAAIGYPLFEKLCECKGILVEEPGVDYERE